MVKLDCAACLSDLEKYLKETTRKLENMVRGFAYEVTLIAIDKTPLGDFNKHADLYALRSTNPNSESYGLRPEVGFAKGSWQVSMDGSLDLQELYGNTSGSTAGKAARTHMLNYKLGDTVYIGNAGPYIAKLENGFSLQAPVGILTPTIQEVSAVYKAKLAHYYAQG